MSFAAFLCGAKVTSETIRPWKDDLREKNYAPSTINACLAALNGFFCFCGWTDCRARFLKIQRRLFRDSRQELTRGEYERLVAAAEATGDRGLALLMETICSTGIRVSEVQYITVEAAKNGKTEIALKGKIRTILSRLSGQVNPTEKSGGSSEPLLFCAALTSAPALGIL